MPLFKKKLLKQFSRKSLEFILDSKLAVADHLVTDDEIKELNQETTELLNLRELLFPPSLPWKSIILRLTSIFVIFGGLGYGSYYLILHPPTIESGSTKVVESDSKSFAYIPLKKVFVSPTSILTRINYDNPHAIMVGDGWTGWGIIKLMAHQNSLRLLSIETKGGKRFITLRTVTSELRPLEDPRTLLSADGISGGSLEKLGEDWILLLTPEKTSQTLTIVRFDEDWKMKGDPLLIQANQPLEDVRGAMLGVLGEKVILVTLKLPPESASVTERAQPIMRLLDPKTLAVVDQSILPGAPDTTFVPGGSFYPNKTGGFDIMLSGHPALEVGAGDVLKGNDIFVLSYTDQYLLKEVSQLTSNGRPHDFLPVDHFQIEGYQMVSTLHITGLPQKKGGPLGYPPESGKAFLNAFGPGWSVEGALILDDVAARFERGSVLEGVSDVRIAAIGDRFYAATLKRLQDPEKSPPEQTVIEMSWQQVPPITRLQ